MSSLVQTKTEFPILPAHLRWRVDNSCCDEIQPVTTGVVLRFKHARKVPRAPTRIKSRLVGEGTSVSPFSVFPQGFAVAMLTTLMDVAAGHVSADAGDADKVAAKDPKEPAELNISAPELSICLPYTEQKRVVKMDLVCQDGYPKLEIRRWRLEASGERRRLDGVMVKYEEAVKVLKMLDKLIARQKDTTVVVDA